jgi:dTDP-4-amino-4,6-dideoxygalactose transaminase
MNIPFNKPYMNGRELFNIAQAHVSRGLAGDGSFTKLCQAKLSEIFNNKPVLLTQSGTAALECALLALKLSHSDEVIVPSFTFVSCANAVILAGGTPIFADINPETQNISLQSLKRLMKPITRALVLVHYAGIASELDEIVAYCRQHGVVVIEDAAHCIGALWGRKELGTFGDLGCLSFHETKNITSGEGGAVIINNLEYLTTVELLREKGTDRSRFLRGEVDKYTWRSLGSSYLPSEITAAFLHAQLEDVEYVTNARRMQWMNYHQFLEPVENEGLLLRPKLPQLATPNGHIYYILVSNELTRRQLIESMKRVGVQLTFHYVPLHSSPYGLQFKADPYGMSVTDDTAARLVRLPHWIGLTEVQQRMICATITLILKGLRP